MIIENIAERLFCDLKNSQIKIKPALFKVDGFKNGECVLEEGVIRNLKQFNIIIDKENQESFTDAYNQLLAKIKELGSTIKFYGLIIPRKAVIECRLEEYESVVCRYIKDYNIGTDELLERWDVLVSEV